MNSNVQTASNVPTASQVPTASNVQTTPADTPADFVAEIFDGNFGLKKLNLEKYLQALNDLIAARQQATTQASKNQSKSFEQVADADYKKTLAKNQVVQAQAAKDKKKLPTFNQQVLNALEKVYVNIEVKVLFKYRHDNLIQEVKFPDGTKRLVLMSASVSRYYLELLSTVWLLFCLGDYSGIITCVSARGVVVFGDPNKEKPDPKLSPADVDVLQNKISAISTAIPQGQFATYQNRNLSRDDVTALIVDLKAFLKTIDPMDTTLEVPQVPIDFIGMTRNQ